MPKLSQQNDHAPFQRIPAASWITGFSQSYLRSGCKTGDVPHVKVGGTYMVNIPALLKKLGAEQED